MKMLGLSPALTRPGKRFGVLVGVGLGLLAILGAAALLIYPLMHREPPLPFQHFAATRLTNSGKVTKTAISADGRYVLNVVKDKARESLWLFNVGTGSNTQITPPQPLYIIEPVFSPDGDYVYYRRATDQTLESFDLLRAPVLGGAEQTVIRNVDGGVTFSPDAKRMAFIRLNDPGTGQILHFERKPGRQRRADPVSRTNSIGEHHFVVAGRKAHRRRDLFQRRWRHRAAHFRFSGEKEQRAG